MAISETLVVLFYPSLQQIHNRDRRQIQPVALSCPGNRRTLAGSSAYTILQPRFQGHHQGHPGAMQGSPTPPESFLEVSERQLGTWLLA